MKAQLERILAVKTPSLRAERLRDRLEIRSSKSEIIHSNLHASRRTRDQHPYSPAPPLNDPEMVEGPIEEENPRRSRTATDDDRVLAVSTRSGCRHRNRTCPRGPGGLRREQGEATRARCTPSATHERALDVLRASSRTSRPVRQPAASSSTRGSRSFRPPADAPAGYPRAWHTTTRRGCLIRVPHAWQLDPTVVRESAFQGRARLQQLPVPVRGRPALRPERRIPTGCYRFQVFVRRTQDLRGTTTRYFLSFEGADAALCLLAERDVRRLQPGQSGCRPSSTCRGFGEAWERTCWRSRWSKFCDGSYLEDQDMWRLSGIFRDVAPAAEARRRTFRTIRIDTPSSVPIRGGNGRSTRGTGRARRAGE